MIITTDKRVHKMAGQHTEEEKAEFLKGGEGQPNNLRHGGVEILVGNFRGRGTRIVQSTAGILCSQQQASGAINRHE